MRKKIILFVIWLLGSTEVPRFLFWPWFFACIMTIYYNWIKPTSAITSPLVINTTGNAGVRVAEDTIFCFIYDSTASFQIKGNSTHFIRYQRVRQVGPYDLGPDSVSNIRIIPTIKASGDWWENDTISLKALLYFRKQMQKRMQEEDSESNEIQKRKGAGHD